MANFTAGTSFTDGVTNDVTAAKLNALIADAVPTSNLSLNSTTGTIATLNSTTGVIPTLTSTTLITTGTGTAAAPAIVPTGDTNTGIFFPAADTIAFSEGGTESMRIDSSRNVGIGTASPSTKLHVIGGNGPLFRIDNNTAGKYYDFGRDATTGYLTFLGVETSFSGYTFQDNNGTSRVTIQNGGNVGIGTVSPSAQLSISFNGTTVAGSDYRNTDSGSGGQNYAIFYRNTTTQIGSITGTGSAISYNTSSDYRLKTNLDPVVNGIERVKQLPVYRFNWKIDEGGNKVDGFVAHEAKAIVPESVVGEKDAVDADGKPIYQGIDQSKIVPLLTAALKEAIAKIETLEAKVAVLEAA